ncbi:MAG: hypothetical protein ACRDWE_03785 [Acidimicrobiales bacterium]
MAHRQETLDERFGDTGRTGLHVLVDPSGSDDTAARVPGEVRNGSRPAEHASPGGERPRGARHRRGRAPQHKRPAHRRGRTQHRRADASSSSLVYVERMPVRRSTLLAIGSLVFVLGIAFGVMTGLGQLVHVLNPAKHFDIFYALHKEYVVASLIAACLLWLLPPHPWAKRLVKAAPAHARTATEEPRERSLTGVTVLADYQDADALDWPPLAEGVGR